MARRVKLIFNPHADRGNSWRVASALQPIIENHGGASWSTTEYPGQATELASQACAEGYDVIAALGGDGTVHEVVNGMMQVEAEDRPLLGVVPLGSGNDFGNNVGVPNDPEAAMARVFTGESMNVDIGVIVDDQGRIEYWDNTLGIGFDASVVIHSNSITRLHGFAMYLWAVIQTILSKHTIAQMRISTESDDQEQDVLMITICNGPREGGGFNVAPDAKPNDGILDYALIRGVSRLTMFRLIPEVMNGTHGKFKQVSIGQLRQAKLTYDRPLAIHADGEVFAGFSTGIRGVEVSIIPEAIRVIV
jgi:YegS/Rv2252/BmrU family lipid kinase